MVLIEIHQNTQNVTAVSTSELLQPRVVKKKAEVLRLLIDLISYDF